jgi:hypothetical protein
MKMRAMQSVVLALLVFATGYFLRDETALLGSSPSAANSGITKAGKTRIGRNVDLVFTGPFVFVEQGPNLMVYLPDVAEHYPPVAVSSGDYVNIITLGRGDYEFTKGISPAGSFPAPSMPVENASLLSYGQSQVKLPGGMPKGAYYLSLKLPVPMQIAPWNADPIRISDQPPAPPVALDGPRLATTTILRYTSAASIKQLLEIDGPSSFVWLPTAKPIGSESIIAIKVAPFKRDDMHTHAKAAFDALKNLIGLPPSTSISFPPPHSQYPRNVPYFQGVLPQDLVDVMPGEIGDCYGPDCPATKGMHSDCMAPSVLITQ